MNRAFLMPVLSNLLLTTFDQRLQVALKGKGILKTFQFVDEYLVVFTTVSQAVSLRAQELFDVFSSVVDTFKPCVTWT